MLLPKVMNPRGKIVKILFFLLLLLVTACAQNVPKTESDVEQISVIFCPQEDCYGGFVGKIEAAQEKVYCAFWDLNLKDFSRVFGEKSSEVDVKIVIDHRNYDENLIAGSNIKVADGNNFMHNKFCVVDSLLITGSMNPTENGMYKNNNNLVFIESKTLVENYKSEFNELWNSIYSSGEPVEARVVGNVENYFCPEDCDSGLNRIVNLINAANSSIKVAAFSFTHELIADALIRADIRGVDVSIVLENRQRNVINSQYQRLVDLGVNITLDTNKNSMHHKFIVVDEEIVITGSPNFSNNGFKRNDENFLIIFDERLAAKFVDEFDTTLK